MSTAPSLGSRGDELAERIGRRLTDLRTARNLRPSDLARRISVSTSLIGQIERGRSRPSVTTLAALADALEVPVDALLAERPAIEVRDGVRVERLRSLDGVDLVQLVYQPGAASAAELTRHPGVEMILVVENRFDVHLGFEVNVLLESDSIVFSGASPHRLVNPTQRVSRAIAVTVHRPAQWLTAAAASSDTNRSS